jgi:zinc-ribbon domain
VRKCPSCGQDNPEGARFCNACASTLEAAPASREQRKTVTVLFCDIRRSAILWRHQVGRPGETATRREPSFHLTMQSSPREAPDETSKRSTGPWCCALLQASYEEAETTDEMAEYLLLLLGHRRKDASATPRAWAEARR